MKTSPQEIWIVETKGQEDLDVPLKMECLKQWCEDSNAAQNKIRFDYVFVDEEEFEKYAPTSFGELVNNFKKYKEQERV